jgi:hypothetical protein
VAFLCYQSCRRFSIPSDIWVVIAQLFVPIFNLGSLIWVLHLTGSLLRSNLAIALCLIGDCPRQRSIPGGARRFTIGTLDLIALLRFFDLLSFSSMFAISPFV